MRDANDRRMCRSLGFHTEEWLCSVEEKEKMGDVYVYFGGRNYAC